MKLESIKWLVEGYIEDLPSGSKFSAYDAYFHLLENDAFKRIIIENYGTTACGKECGRHFSGASAVVKTLCLIANTDTTIRQDDFTDNQIGDGSVKPGGKSYSTWIKR